MRKHIPIGITEHSRWSPRERRRVPGVGAYSRSPQQIGLAFRKFLSKATSTLLGAHFVRPPPHAANLAMTDTAMLDQAKLGVLPGSVLSAVLGMAILWWLPVPRGEV
jgi:hypothetical protein